MLIYRQRHLRSYAELHWRHEHEMCTPACTEHMPDRFTHGWFLTSSADQNNLHPWGIGKMAMRPALHTDYSAGGAETLTFWVIKRCNQRAVSKCQEVCSHYWSSLPSGIWRRVCRQTTITSCKRKSRCTSEKLTTENLNANCVLERVTQPLTEMSTRNPSWG